MPAPPTRPNLADPATRAHRRSLLAAPHAAPLAAYVEALRGATAHYVPDIDPLDGGIAARLVFILEKPGPRVVPPAGSGFVSRDTDDPTARAIETFMREAAIPREATLLWNTCPWWTGSIATPAAEFRAGALALPALLTLLPQLAAAVLVGNAAARYAAPMLPAGLPRYSTVHPGGQARGRSSQCRTMAADTGHLATSLPRGANASLRDTLMQLGGSVQRRLWMLRRHSSE